jgi:hypothetical protein
MITEHDLPRLITKLNTYSARSLMKMPVENATTDWAKNYWFEVFRKLCKCIRCDRIL